VRIPATPHKLLCVWHIVILSFCLSQRLYSQSAEFTIPSEDDLQVITTENAVELHELAKLTSANPVLKFFFSPDSTTLYSGSNYAPIEVWDLESGTREVFDVDYGFFGFAVSSDNTLLAVNSSTDLGGIGLYDIATGERIADIPCSGGSLTIAFNPADSQSLIVGKISGKPETLLHFWRLTSELPSGWDEENIRKCKPDSAMTVSTLNNLTISLDGQLLLYGNHLLNMNTLIEVATLPYAHEEAISAAAFSPNSQQLATATSSFVRIWNADGVEIGEIDLSDPQQKVGPWISSVAYSPDGELLALGGAGVIEAPCQPCNFVALSNTTTFEQIVSITLEDDIPLGETVAFSPDGKLLAVGGSVIYLYGIPESASVTPDN
jgi:WD40 repeat protein